jgi:hypothetical protein
VTKFLAFDSRQDQIADAFRVIVRRLQPAIREVNQYGIPFFHHYGRCFYLSPKGKGVDIGFCRGAMLSQQVKLSGQDRKVIRLLHIESEDDLDGDLEAILKEALMLNETLSEL